MDSSRQSHSQCLRVWENSLPTVYEMAREMANSNALINCQHNKEIPWVSSLKAALITLREWVANLIWMCQITLAIGKNYPFEAEEVFIDHVMNLRTWKLNSWWLELFAGVKNNSCIKKRELFIINTPIVLHYTDNGTTISR